VSAADRLARKIRWLVIVPPQLERVAEGGIPQRDKLVLEPANPADRPEERLQSVMTSGH
jgi:hypothetical protein